MYSLEAKKEAIHRHANGQKPWAVIIAGPTASGKSALALHVAQRLDGVIINADSMQIYRELRILTARPSPEDEALCPHALYGVLSARENGSVAWWRKQAIAALDYVTTQGNLPILCGGTGLYLQALIQGLALIPDPDVNIRQQARDILQTQGSAILHNRLSLIDQEMAARLHPSDGQRIARAWEVKMSTGRSLLHWQTQPGLPSVDYRFVVLRLDPERDVLAHNITDRFQNMMTEGATEEVQRLLALNLPSTLPAMRAHGVPELIAYLKGTITREEAMARAVNATLRYTKRQRTWYRHHALAPDSFVRIFSSKTDQKKKEMKNFYDESISFIINKIDAI